MRVSIFFTSTEYDYIVTFLITLVNIVTVISLSNYNFAIPKHHLKHDICLARVIILMFIDYENRVPRLLQPRRTGNWLVVL